jgi:hypothetical protein
VPFGRIIAFDEFGQIFEANRLALESVMDVRLASARFD